MSGTYESNFQSSKYTFSRSILIAFGKTFPCKGKVLSMPSDWVVSDLHRSIQCPFLLRKHLNASGRLSLGHLKKILINISRSIIIHYVHIPWWLLSSSCLLYREPCIASRFFTNWAIREAQLLVTGSSYFLYSHLLVCLYVLSPSGLSFSPLLIKEI